MNGRAGYLWSFSLLNDLVFGEPNAMHGVWVEQSGRGRSRNGNGNKRFAWGICGLALALVLGGCDARVTRPDQVVLTARPEGVAPRVPGEVPVTLAISNRGGGRIRLAIDGKRGPPYDVNWIYYRVFRKDGVRWIQDDSLVPFADGTVSVYTLRIGSGDSAILRVYLERITQAMCAAVLRIDLEDMSGTFFRSSPFRPCQQNAGQSALSS